MLEQKIDDHMSMHNTEGNDIHDKMHVFGELLRNTAEETLPEVKARSQRPWISARTLHYIDERTAARSAGDKHKEIHLHKLVKSSVKQDRTSWLFEFL